MTFRHLRVCFAGLFLGLMFSGAAFAQAQIGDDLIGEFVNDLFGSRVGLSADGSRMVVGSITNSETFQGSGQVQVFENVNGTWMQLGQDINGTGLDARLGRGVSISGDGTTIAAGADGFNNAAGKVRVFEFSNGSWVQLGQELLGSNNFGNEVRLSADGSILAVGAPRGTGSVTVYQNMGGTWVQLGDDITGDGEFFGNGLGLSANGLRVAIGAEGSIGATGSFRVFDFVGANWTQVGETVVGEPGDRIGSSIDISDDGSIVAVSAIGNEDMGGGSGAARVYRDTGGTWTQVGGDLNGTPLNRFGSSLSLSSDGIILTVGGFGDGFPAAIDADGMIIPGEGPSARIFRNENDDWVQLGRVFGERGSFFGLQSDLSGDGLTLAVGAQSFDDSGFDRGLVRAFDLEPLFVIHADVNLDGIVNFLDIAPFISVLASEGSPAEEAAADCNMDGVVSFLDISPFIMALTLAGQ